MATTGGARRDLAPVLGDFARAMAAQPGVEAVLARLGDALMSLLPVEGVGTLLRDGRGGMLFATANSETGRVVEKLEVELGEGPCTDALSTGAQVLVPDLAAEAGRYPRFVPRAIEAGVRAIHALPMTVRVDPIGSVDLICTEPRDLSGEDLATGQLLADVAISYIVHSRAYEESTELAAQLQTALDSRVVLEQAKGILAERHGISPTEAFNRLRSHSRSRQLKIHDAAQRVIAGELRL